MVGTNYIPFDPVYGLKDEDGNLMSKEAIEKLGGVFVDFELKPEPNDMLATHFVNPQTGEQWYEYEERPKTEMELMKEENEALKKSQADQDELLMQLMLTTGGN